MALFYLVDTRLRSELSTYRSLISVQLTIVVEVHRCAAVDDRLQAFSQEDLAISSMKWD